MKCHLILVNMLLGFISLSQEKNEIYILFESNNDEFNKQSIVDNNKENNIYYRFYKANSLKYTNENEGYIFFHRKVKGVEFLDIEEKHWRPKTTKLSKFDRKDKIVLDQYWFLKYDEELIFNFFHDNRGLEIFIVNFNEKDNNYTLRQAVFTNNTTAVDLHEYDKEIDSDLINKYKLIICKNQILKVDKSE